MAGSLTISTLKNDTGVLATQNGMTGIPKAWVNFDGVTTTTIRGSFNVSSVTRNGTGDYTINYTTSMPNVNYAWSASCGYGTTAASDGLMVSLYGAFATYQLVGSVRIYTTDPSAATSGQAFDATYVGFMAISS
jgi:hypothetical protein